MNDASKQEGTAAILEASTFDRHCGIELVEVTDSRVIAAVPVRPELLQPTGVVHGGQRLEMLGPHSAIGEARMQQEQCRSLATFGVRELYRHR